MVIDFFELAGGHDVIDTTADGFLPSLLAEGGQAVGVVLGHLVDAPGATLIHCHTGKDRTGFTIAMILALLGVDDDAIVADYAHSVPIFEAMVANLRAAGLGVPDTAPLYAREAPSPSGMAATLARLRAGWPSPEAWFLEQGVDADLLSRTRDLLVVTPTC